MSIVSPEPAARAAAITWLEMAITALLQGSEKPALEFIRQAQRTIAHEDDL